MEQAGWRREAWLGSAGLLHFLPVLHWMTSTQTARHHDGHSPPLMSPSHSWTHRCALQHQQRGLPPWKTDCLLQSQTPQQIHRVKWGPPAVYLKYNYVCLCLWRCARAVFFFSLLPLQATTTPAACSQRALTLPCFRLFATCSVFFPSGASQVPTPCSSISHRKAPLAPGEEKKKKRSLYHGAFTHISHSLNPFSNLLMRVTWQYQRRLLR